MMTAAKRSGAARASKATSDVLPDGFRFGVATAGFQGEGGFNGPGEPGNNWLGWESLGRVEPSGLALDFWRRYEEHLDRVAGIGCDAFRLSIEWARVEPRDGEVDSTALDAYASILDACRERGLEPLVTLHHFTHPSWLGEEFWLLPDSPERFAKWVEIAVTGLAERCSHWVTINEMNVLANLSYIAGMFPPGRYLDVRSAVLALDHLLAAHVLAYDVVHRIQENAVVGTNNASMSVYEMDRLLTDVLCSRSEGIDREDLAEWLEERRDAYYRDLGKATAPEAITRRWAAYASAGRGMGRMVSAPLTALASSVDAVYSSAHSRALDVAQLDYYDPMVSRHLRLPGHMTAGGRSWALGRQLWDDVVVPRELISYARLAQVRDAKVWVVENGLCNRVRRGRSYLRADGWDRPRYLRENVSSVVSAIDAGLPMGAYYHWTLADNYEWGSYEPRFGLFGIDRDRGLRWSEMDSMGRDAAGAYKRIIEGLRSGDRSVLEAG